VGEAGLLADPDDHDEFTGALLEAACDEEVRAGLVERGRRRAASYSWERTAALTDQAIGGLLDDNAAPNR
jgi:glycosyltransferase involved in cell wall biosynthesis